METTIIRLPEIVKGRGANKGFVYELIQRSGNVCMYAVYGSEKAWESKSTDLFEVFTVGMTSSVFEDGKFVHKEGYFKEVYPGLSSFGASAWCMRNKDRAELRFRELVEKKLVEVAV